MSQLSLHSLPVSWLHRSSQILFLAITAVTGIQFWFFAMWAMGKSDIFISRPPSVEGFLPISALLALERFFMTGLWDTIHPAGLAILIFALLISFLVRKSFCGHICPVGTLEFFLFKLGRKLHWTCDIPPRIARWMVIPRYLLLLFFIRILCIFDVNGLNDFIASRYNLVCDTKMLLFFLHGGMEMALILLFLAIGSLVIPSFWCRCFCPYGALLGLFGLFSPVHVTRDTEMCINCKKCTHSCPQGIHVHLKQTVRGTDCTTCLECISACPKKGCLSLSCGYRKTSALGLPHWIPSVSAAGGMLGTWLLCLVTGHWYTIVPTSMLKTLHEGIELLRHY